MFPIQAANDTSNVRTRDAKALTHVLRRPPISVEIPNLADVIIGQPRFTIAYPDSPSAPALGNPISGVVKVCSQEQVIGAKAFRPVAFVTHKHPFRDRPNRKAIGYAVNLLVLVAHFNNPVTPLIKTARPVHAGVPIWDDLEQFVEQCASAGGKVALAAKATLAILAAINIATYFARAMIDSTHLSALHWRWCMALTAFACCGAFSIVPQECV